MVEIRLPDYVTVLMERLEAAGEEVYLVGGSLRDILLGTEPHDFDLATSALPTRTASLFSDHRVITTGLKHGTVTVLSEGNPVEITTFRIDGSYTDARHPDEVTFTRQITEDLSRRDFTVNAMAYHPSRGIVDPFGGASDLSDKLLRAVGDPQTRFSEDALRVMRAFRFAAQLGFSIDEKTLRGAAQTKDGLAAIARERIASEFLRLLLSPAPAEALYTMINAGVLPYVTGEYVPRPAIIETLADLPATDVARLGHFFSDASREQIEHCLSSLKYSNKQITGARAVAVCGRQSVLTPADARRLIASCGVYASSAVRSSVALGLSPVKAIELVEQNNAPCTLSQLAVGGKDLVALGIRGKEIGETLEYLLAAALDNPTVNKKENLLALAQKRRNTHILSSESKGKQSK